MSKQINNNIRDNYVNHYDRLCNVSLFYNDVNYDFIKKFLPLDLKACMLDIGCGHGQLLSWLYKTGYRNISGIDSSGSMIKSAKEKLSPEVKLIQDNAYGVIKDKKDFYNAIFLFDVIEHFNKKEITEFINSVYDSLKDEGILIIRTPNMANPLGIYSRYNDFTHEIGFIEFSLMQLLENTEFRNITIIPTVPGKLKLRILRLVYQFFLKIIFKLELRAVPAVFDSNITVYAQK